MRTSLVCLVALLIIAVFLGCVSNSPRGGESGFSQNLKEGALTTYVEYIKAVNTGIEPAADSGIPPSYWAPAIGALHPARVYAHHANLVVVRNVEGAEEQGLYITLVISSYIPRSGDDGFEFDSSPSEASSVRGIFEYRRVVGR